MRDLRGSKMKAHLFVLVIAIGLSAPQVASAASSHRTKSYVTKKGTYVPSHRATNPNKSKADNWSSKGNSNPYTGKNGTKKTY